MDPRRYVGERSHCAVMIYGGSCVYDCVSPDKRMRLNHRMGHDHSALFDVGELGNVSSWVNRDPPIPALLSESLDLIFPSEVVSDGNDSTGLIPKVLDDRRMPSISVDQSASSFCL